MYGSWPRLEAEPETLVSGSPLSRQSGLIWEWRSDLAIQAAIAVQHTNQCSATHGNGASVFFANVKGFLSWPFEELYFFSGWPVVSRQEACSYTLVFKQQMQLCPVFRELFLGMQMPIVVVWGHFHNGTFWTIGSQQQVWSRQLILGRLPSFPLLCFIRAGLQCSKLKIH